MILFGLKAMWWVVIALVVVVAALIVGIIWSLDRGEEPLPIARTATAKQRRAWRRERLDITRATRGRS